MKKIVVGIDGSKESFDSYKCAASLYPDENIALTSVFVRDERKTQIPFIYSGAAYDIAYERLYIPADPQLTETYKKLNEDNKIFAKKCIEMCDNIETGSNIKKSSLISKGEPVEELVKISKDCDLLVLGQRGENSAYARELIGSTSEDLIRKSLAPVLICPGDTIRLDRFLIVYEESESSINAIKYYFNNLYGKNTELTILIKDHFEDSRKSISGMISELNHTMKNINIKQCNGALAHSAVETMEKGFIDAVILGSHGKHKLTEYLLGSVTVHIIRRTNLPVFIVH